jgi:Uma2 family endonuclease
MSTSRIKPRIRQRIGPSSAGLRMSRDEFDALTRFDDRYRYELVHGVLVVTPPPAEAERDSNGELEYLLRFYKKHHPQGSALDKTLTEHEIRPGEDARRADRVIWAGLGRTPDPEKDIPTIAIEFVSRGRRDWLRDYAEKRAEYLALGILEYWVIDRFRRSMTVYRKPPGAPAEQVIAETEVYRTDLLPGFELPLARIMAEADDWPKKKRKRR